MKIIKVLMFLLLALFLTGNGFTAIGATINPGDYWVLEDGYNMGFSSGKPLTVTETSGENRYNVNFMGTGTWTLGYDTSGNLLMYGATMSGGGHFDVVNPQNAALFPSEMVVGDTHTIVLQRNEYETGGAYHGQGRSSVAVTVSGPETITVPAGTFTTYRFHYADTWSDSWGNSGISISTFWLAEDIGWVKVKRSGVAYELQGQEDEGSPPSAPQLSVSTSDVTLSLSWSAQSNAEGYTLFYAPYPYTGPETIGTIDMGAETGGSFSLWEGAAFYLAVETYNSFGKSGLSNIEYFVMGYSLSVYPSSLNPSVDETDSCAISGGTSPYNATSSNTAIASVSVSGNTLSVTGVSEGSATLTAYDNAGDSVTVSVVIVANPDPGAIPSTGLKVCYDDSKEITCPQPGEAFYGQDACYTINPRSYTKLDDSGNTLAASATSWSMVLDNVTGLIWEVKADNGSIHDRDNEYIWDDAQDVFVAALNSSRFGGYSDWRLPTFKELAYLVDYGTRNPTIDTNFFPNTKSSIYWSSTPHANTALHAWWVGFWTGANYVNEKSNTFYVRAVRGGQ